MPLEEPVVMTITGPNLLDQRTPIIRSKHNFFKSREEKMASIEFDINETYTSRHRLVLSEYGLKAFQSLQSEVAKAQFVQKHSEYWVMVDGSQDYAHMDAGSACNFAVSETPAEEVAQNREQETWAGCDAGEVTRPVGEAGPVPGADGFTMACFNAEEVPVGTQLYTGSEPADQQAPLDAAELQRKLKASSEALERLIQAVEHTSLGVRGIKAVENAKSTLAATNDKVQPGPH